MPARGEQVLGGRMKHIRSFILVATSLGLIHCSKAPSTKWTQTPAPQKESDLGYIVTATTAEMEAVQANLPQAKIRRLNETLFEVSNVDAHILKSFLTHKNLEKNQFVKTAIVKKANPVFKAKSTTPDAEQALQTCVKSDKAPELNIDINYNPETLTIELGEEVKITASATVNAEVGGDVRYIWDLDGTPDYSALKLEKGIAQEQTFKPDSVGEFRLVVIAQDKNLSCSFAIVPVLVTANPKPSTDQQLAKIPSTDKFVQLKAINATEAWTTTRGDGITIAVLDTGLNYNHPGIRDNIAWNTKENSQNLLDNDNNGFKNDFIGWDFVNGDNLPFDDAGHGSHVSGLIASPIMGVAPQAKILPIKILNAAGAGDMASIVAGIHYAVDRGAKIINMSLTLDDMSHQGAPPAMIDAIEYARSKNVLVLAAAGNGDDKGIGFNIEDRPNYPAAFDKDNLIAVSATAKGKITEYSNFSKKLVHLAAPGGEFFAGQPPEAQEPLFSLATLNPTDRPFAPMVGTSMATPVASGLAALVMSANSTLSLEKVRSIMMETGDSLDSLTNKTVSGKQINARKAVEKALDLKPASTLK